MSQREKIILLLMAVAIVIGGYILLNPTSGNKKGVDNTALELKEITAMVVQATADLDSNSLTEAETYATTRAEEEWARDDLFISRPAPSVKNETAEGNPLLADFVYSGFLQVAGLRMVIINGLEFKDGEIIEPGEFVVRAIHPRSVVIEMTEIHADYASTPSEARKLIIPLAE